MKPRISNQKTRALTKIEVLVVVAVVFVFAGVAFLVIHHAKPVRRNAPQNQSSKIPNAPQNQSTVIPNVQQDQASAIRCVNNLKQIGLAFRIWEGDNGGKYPMQVPAKRGGAMEPAARGDVAPIFQVMSNELSTPKILVCPADADRSPVNSFTTGFDNSHISYFVGVDASDRFPQRLLSGDSNLAVDDVPANSGLLKIMANQSVTWTAGWHLNQGHAGLADGSVQTASSSFLQNMLLQTGLATNRLAIP